MTFPEILNTLSERERDVVDLVAAGRTNSEIARTLQISIHTVRNHTHSIFQKTGLENRLDLAVVALCYGLADKEAACAPIVERAARVRKANALVY